MTAVLAMGLFVVSACDTTSPDVEPESDKVQAQTNQIPEPGCYTCASGYEVCTDRDGNGVIGDGDCPEDDGGSGGGGDDGSDDSNDAWADFSCKAKSSGELSVSITGPCETWLTADHTWYSRRTNPDDYYFVWYVEYDLGKGRASASQRIRSGYGANTVNTEEHVTPYEDNRFRLTVQVQKRDGSKSGEAHMGVEGVDNPYQGDLLSDCGSDQDFYPFREISSYDFNIDTGTTTPLYNCYVRDCSGSKKYQRDGEGDKVETRSCAASSYLY